MISRTTDDLGRPRHARGVCDLASPARWSITPGEICPETFTPSSSSHLRSQRETLERIGRAVKRVGDTHLANTAPIDDDWSLVRERRSRSSCSPLSRLWRSPDGQDYVIAADGARDAVADLHHFDDARLRERDVSLATRPRQDSG